jgi:hypothetical protein
MKKLELFVTYNQNDQVKEDEMGKACNKHGEKASAYRILVGKFEGKLPLRIHKCRWEDNIKIKLRMMWYGMDSSGS